MLIDLLYLHPLQGSLKDGALFAGARVITVDIASYHSGRNHLASLHQLEESRLLIGIRI